MTDNVFTWREPPPALGPPMGRWATIAHQLRQRPGQWALVVSYEKSTTARTTATLVKRGRYTGVPAGEFEAVSRREGDVFNVYARYIGGGDAPVEDALPVTRPVPPSTAGGGAFEIHAL